MGAPKICLVVTGTCVFFHYHVEYIYIYIYIHTYNESANMAIHIGDCYIIIYTYHLGISSSQLTNPHIFQRGSGSTTNQKILVMDDHLHLESHRFLLGIPPWLGPQVTGGTGALGLVFAEWMASLGARLLGGIRHIQWL